MIGQEAAGEFGPAVRFLVDPDLNHLGSQLGGIDSLSRDEIGVLVEAARESWYAAVRLRTSRVFLLELHAQRLGGRLDAPTPAGRWDQFLDRCQREEFWGELATTYPTLRHRLSCMLDTRRAAVVELARRVTTDRSRLNELTGVPAGRLVEARFDAGDAHRGGRSVAVLHFDGGRVVYKPRNLCADRALAGLVAGLAPGGELAVARVVLGDGYGFAAYVRHQYARDVDEQRQFYWALGGWLAVMRLLRGADLHAENIIAAGAVPVVVDCETLFTPQLPPPPSGLGEAVDRASRAIDATVLRSGLMPWRQTRLAMRGVDYSAVGALPGQQPMLLVPAIVGAGTDEAMLAMTEVQLQPAANHPTALPHPETFHRQLLAGFRDVAKRIDRLDDLPEAIAAFRGCELRQVTRATQVYVEVARMLWHPASLADEPAAVARAVDVLTRNAGPGPLCARHVVEAEVADLLDDDIPMFTFMPEAAVVRGRDGVVLATYGDQLAAALERWHGVDLDFEAALVRASLAGAYQQARSPVPRIRATTVRAARLGERRRDLVDQLVRRLCEEAIWGADATVTWIGPALHRGDWMVRPLGPDLYSGQAGVVVALRAYLRVAGRGARASGPLQAQVRATLTAALRVLNRMEDNRDSYSCLGAYTGLASGIWARLLLHRLDRGSAHLTRARRLASQIPDRLAEGPGADLLAGVAGAIPVLLALAHRTDDRGYLAMARLAAQALAAKASWSDRMARWPSAAFPDGIGGFAHGSAGIGWALARLGLVTGESRHREVAEAAFTHQRSLWRADAGSWLDMRDPGRSDFPATWCNGSTGTALAGWDLYRRGAGRGYRDLARSGGAVVRAHGFGRGHTLCHGELGSYELVAALAEAEPASARAHRRRAAARVISGIEEHGPVTDLTGDASSPGLMAGVAGIIYQLLRMSPGSGLPSVLLPGS